MILRAGQIKIHIEYLPLASFCICAVVFGEKFLPSLLCVAIHEAGHVFALLRLGSTPPELSLGFLTIDIIDRQKEMRNSRQQAFIAAAGPGANLLTAPLFYLLGISLKSDFFGSCAMISAVLCVFNLLPIIGTDGGELIGILLMRTRQGTAALYILTVIILLPLCICAFYILIISKNNFTLLITSLVLIYSFLKMLG